MRSPTKDSSSESVGEAFAAAVPADPPSPTKIKIKMEELLLPLARIGRLGGMPGRNRGPI